jgi:hypothetical protein
VNRARRRFSLSPTNVLLASGDLLPAPRSGHSLQLTSDSQPGRQRSGDVPLPLALDPVHGHGDPVAGHGLSHASGITLNTPPSSHDGGYHVFRSGRRGRDVPGPLHYPGAGRAGAAHHQGNELVMTQRSHRRSGDRRGPGHGPAGRELAGIPRATNPTEGRTGRCSSRRPSTTDPSSSRSSRTRGDLLADNELRGRPKCGEAVPASRPLSSRTARSFLVSRNPQKVFAIHRPRRWPSGQDRNWLGRIKLVKVQYDQRPTGVLPAPG